MYTEEDLEWKKIAEELRARGFGVVEGKEAVLAKIKEIEEKNPISHTTRTGVIGGD